MATRVFQGHLEIEDSLVTLVLSARSDQLVSQGHPEMLADLESRVRLDLAGNKDSKVKC